MSIAQTHDYLGWLRLARAPDGSPYFAMPVHWDTSDAHRWSLFRWEGRGWVPHGAAGVAASDVPELVIRAQTPARIVSLGLQDLATLQIWMLGVDAGPDTIGAPDSIFSTTVQSTEFGSAESASRKWAARSEQRQPDLQFHVRVFYSDTLPDWREVPSVGLDEDHCTIAPLDDTTAVVVYAGQSGLQYAILAGSRWVETGNLDPRPFNAAHPRFRLRHSGGLWLFWADNDWMHMSTYRSGRWDRGDSLRCVPNVGETFRPTFLDAEGDTTEYPTIAWTNSGYGNTLRDVTAIAFPNGHGWDEGEEVPDSEMSGWIPPSLTHDVNGDVWIAWRRAREGINRWTHTYCSATCAAPRVTATGSGARVNWTLTQPAPASRWTVLRAPDGGSYDSLGTVRAQQDGALVFEDTTAEPGLRWTYRVRRESVDLAYRWVSDSVSFWRPDVRRPIGLSFANPAGAQLELRLEGASGELRAQLLDLQGRRVLDVRSRAGGTGADKMVLDLDKSASTRAGIYFLRVTDSTGRTSGTRRVAIVR